MERNINNSPQLLLRYSPLRDFWLDCFRTTQIINVDLFCRNLESYLCNIPGMTDMASLKMAVNDLRNALRNFEIKRTGGEIKKCLINKLCKIFVRKLNFLHVGEFIISYLAYSLFFVCITFVTLSLIVFTSFIFSIPLTIHFTLHLLPFHSIPPSSVFSSGDSS